MPRQAGRGVLIIAGLILMVTLVNQQTQVRISLRRLEEFLERARRALRLGRREFSVCFVRDREIRKHNLRYRGQDRATDVLSFAWQADRNGGKKSRPEQEIGPEYLGDLLISAETARRQARQERHSTQKELCFLMLHGLLHLVGMDHERDRGEMVRKEHALRERLGLCGAEQNRSPKKPRKKRSTGRRVRT